MTASTANSSQNPDIIAPLPLNGCTAVGKTERVLRGYGIKEIPGHAHGTSGDPTPSGAGCAVQALRQIISEPPRRPDHRRADGKRGSGRDGLRIAACRRHPSVLAMVEKMVL